MAVSVNYSGRLTDLFIFYGAKPVGDQRITLSLGDSGEVITGIQKLVQSFTILFLTERGSLPLFPDLGTIFITEMRNRNIRDESSIKAFFAASVEQVAQTLALADEGQNLPPDELFASAVLLNFTPDIGNGKLFLRVQVNSVAGPSRTIFLPVPLAIT